MLGERDSKFGLVISKWRCTKAVSVELCNKCQPESEFSVDDVRLTTTAAYESYFIQRKNGVCVWELRPIVQSMHIESGHTETQSAAMRVSWCSCRFTILLVVRDTLLD